MERRPEIRLMNRSRMIGASVAGEDTLYAAAFAAAAAVRQIQATGFFRLLLFPCCLLFSLGCQELTKQTAATAATEQVDAASQQAPLRCRPGKCVHPRDQRHLVSELFEISIVAAAVVNQLHI